MKTDIKRRNVRPHEGEFGEKKEIIEELGGIGRTVDYV